MEEVGRGVPVAVCQRSSVIEGKIRMRTPLMRAGAGVLGAILLLLVALPLTAAADTAKNVTNNEEAWFMAKKEFLAEPTGEDPTCELPTGCNVSGTAQRPSQHPEQVMVVAANNGDPDAQTFFNFDTTGLPVGAVVTGGTVTMPVATDPDARNVRPQDAKMVACLVTGFIPGGTDAGSYKDRPTFDEKTCVPVKQVERKEETDPVVFTVDLERFGKKWSSGAFMSGITVMVDPKIKPPAPDETWRVVFNTKRRADQKTEEEKKSDKPKDAREQYKPIVSTLEYKVVKSSFPTIGPATTTDTGDDFTTSDTSEDFTTTDTTGTTGTSSGFTSGGGGTAAPPADTGVIEPPPAAETAAAPMEAPVAAAEPTAEQPVAAAPAAATNVGISPAVWVMPVLALAMAAAMAWSLMHPVELAGNREGAVSRLMRTRRLGAADPSPES